MKNIMRVALFSEKVRSLFPKERTARSPRLEVTKNGTLRRKLMTRLTLNTMEYSSDVTKEHKEEGRRYIRTEPLHLIRDVDWRILVSSENIEADRLTARVSQSVLT
jgi:hypothetical protein